MQTSPTIQSPSSISRSTALLSLAIAALVTGCGGGGDEIDNGAPLVDLGDVPAPWSAYCVATFTEDYAVTSVFDEELFTAKSGDAFLMASWEEFAGDAEAELIVFTPKGPEKFTISAPADAPVFPFTSNCEYENTTPYYATFTDVIFYATEDLNDIICEIPAETILPLEPGGVGFSFAGDDPFQDGPATYMVQLNAFRAQCGGAENGYVSVPQTEVFGVTTNLVPLISLIGP